MKKLLLILFFGIFLSGCSFEEKNQFEQAVLEQMQEDPDLKDYKIDPERMTKCVVDVTSKKMPGWFPWDPKRGPYYIGYSKLISVSKSEDPKKAIEEATEIFGSAKEVMQARMNYSQSVMDCLTSMVLETEQ